MFYKMITAERGMCKCELPPPPEFSIIYKLLHHLNLNGRREVSMSLCKACGQPLVFPTHLAQTEKAFVRPKRAFMAI